MVQKIDKKWVRNLSEELNLFCSPDFFRRKIIIERYEKMNKNLFTVNVIEISGSNIIQLVAFPESLEGNENAENLFKQMVKENNSETTEEEMNVCLDNGIFTKNDYSVLIVHST